MKTFYTTTAALRAVTFAASLVLTGVPVSAADVGKPILRLTRIESEVGVGRAYGFKRVRDNVRYGRKAQRFEIRHGDCGGNKYWDDCTNDRQRIERKEDPKDRIQRVGSKVWYGWSMYLDPNYPDLGKTNAAFGQVKMRNWRSPLWMIKLKSGRLNLNIQSAENCFLAPLSQLRGRWTDFVLYADYSQRPTGPSLILYLNGEKVCTYNKPMVTPAMAQVENGQLNVKYGIYNSYVSRWLDLNKTKTVAPLALDDRFDLSDGTRGKSGSPAAEPFAYDWGVKLPTQVVYYDEMRYGTRRDQVDVRMIEARGGKPAD
ncbi:polysaccharide lyase [Shimia sp. R10_1]|uniref:heparin lyase I family protein n=1 Tax=Shimia sp. R10_1 TaxID=2821095 RepID=UPI001ADC9431|nr:heparin lyase I family protein [Shimia sp. R10_1]MBO9473363.1 polysaccharide lyase [Shimia sp. R10_1]